MSRCNLRSQALAPEVLTYLIENMPLAKVLEIVVAAEELAAQERAREEAYRAPARSGEHVIGAPIGALDVGDGASDTTVRALARK